MMMKRPQPGVTLVELIVVIVITGIIAGVLSLILVPAFQNYATITRRANLSQHADTALRRIVTEVRTAVPNSLRAMDGAGTSSCLEMVPTTGGGRFRADADPANTAADPLDLTQADASFDVLTPLSRAPAADDWIVIGNQNTDDLYAAASKVREQVGNVASYGTGASSVYAQHRITLKATKQFPFGYEGGRFSIVPDTQKAVTYFCDSPGLANGKGTGTVWRYSGYGFQPAQTCAPAGAGLVANRVATKVSSCSFLYSPGLSATQQSGFVQMKLTLTDGGESVTLTVGATVENMP